MRAPLFHKKAALGGLRDELNRARDKFFMRFPLCKRFNENDSHNKRCLIGVPGKISHSGSAVVLLSSSIDRSAVTLKTFTSEMSP